MLEQVRDFIKNSQPTQFLLVLLVGVAVGAIFYPTKHIEEREKEKHELETKTLNEQHARELSQLHETLDKTVSDSKQYRSETESKITKLTTENSTLRSRQRVSTYKLVKPDGTIEEKSFTETDVDESKQVVTSIQEEFKQKVASIETKWETIHKDRVAVLQKEFDSKEETYKHQIDELSKEKIVDINKKSFGVEAGVLTSLNYYGHATYDVFGPFFLGLHGQFGPSSAAGVGLGLRF